MLPRFEAILAESPRWTGGKQRLTATRLHEIPAPKVTVAATLVNEAVAEWSRAICHYDYCDETGRVLYKVERLGPKGFRQRRPRRRRRTTGERTQELLHLALL